MDSFYRERDLRMSLEASEDMNEHLREELQALENENKFLEKSLDETIAALREVWSTFHVVAPFTSAAVLKENPILEGLLE